MYDSQLSIIDCTLYLDLDLETLFNDTFNEQGAILHIPSIL